MGKLYLFNVYTFSKSLRVINVGPYMVDTACPYVFRIYMIRCGWLGTYPTDPHNSFVDPFAFLKPEGKINIH